MHEGVSKVTRRAGVRWWRWRRNPLRRTSDVVEAWLLLVAWTLAVLGVTKAHEFFEQYGPKSLVLARFVPIVRTFTPI
ncbi:hypothetical protein ABZ651_24505, partial [Streptomyces sp. NPDC007070]